MNYFCYLLIILALGVLLIGFNTYKGNQDLLTKVHGKKNKQYLKRLGKIIMLSCLSPLLTGIVGIFIENVIIIFLILVISFIVIMIFANSYIKE